MGDPSLQSQSDPGQPGYTFPSTHWTTLLVPLQDRAGGAEIALERLFEIYRSPLVAFARRLVKDQSEAEDIAHDFICALLRREDLTRTRRENGKFRSFLCAGLRNYVINYLNAKHAQKRGGGSAAVPLDELLVPPADPANAEVEFYRRWIQTSVTEVLRGLEAEWTSAHKADEFADLREFALSKKGDFPRTELAEKYGVSVNAVDAKISRLRRRFRESLRALIGQTVSGPEEVDEEIRFLMSVLSK